MGRRNRDTHSVGVVVDLFECFFVLAQCPLAGFKFGALFAEQAVELAGFGGEGFSPDAGFFEAGGVGVLFVDAALLLAPEPFDFGGVGVEGVLCPDAGLAEGGEFGVEFAALLAQRGGVGVDTRKMVLGLVQIGVDDFDLPGKFVEFALASEEPFGSTPRLGACAHTPVGFDDCARLGDKSALDRSQWPGPEHQRRVDVGDKQRVAQQPIEQRLDAGVSIAGGDGLTESADASIGRVGEPAGDGGGGGCPAIDQWQKGDAA